MVVDSVSSLNLYLTDKSSFIGAINSDGEAGEVYVELSGGSTWTLTGDSYITSLTCDADSIDLNGFTLYVDGKAYTEGSASTGTAIEVETSASKGTPDSAPGGDSGSKPSGDAPDGAPGNPPDGAPGGDSSGSGSNGAPSGTPPEKPGSSSGSDSSSN